MQHSAVLYIRNELGASVGRMSASIASRNPLLCRAQHEQWMHLSTVCGVDPNLRGWSSRKNLMIRPLCPYT